MKTIQFNNQTIIGVHVLTRVTDGNHVPFSEKKFITLFDESLKEIEISEWDYESSIVGSGVRKYSATIERGGGRHNFYGTDLEEAKQYLAEELGKSAQPATV
jgi:hypothetical protein